MKSPMIVLPGPVTARKASTLNPMDSVHPSECNRADCMSLLVPRPQPAHAVFGLLPQPIEHLTTSSPSSELRSSTSKTFEKILTLPSQ